MKKGLKKIAKFIYDPGTRFSYLTEMGLTTWMSDEHFIKTQFRYSFGRELDLENPQSFSEKIQWLKLYDRKDIYTVMVDKYEAKKYVQNIIGEKYIIPTLGVWNSVDEIEFDNLPNKFVLKCTHDSGGIVICKDKNQLNIKAAKNRLNKCLKRNYFLVHREWPYKNVRPRVIAEQYIESTTISRNIIEKIQNTLHRVLNSDRTSDILDIWKSKDIISYSRIDKKNVQFNVLESITSKLDQIKEIIKKKTRTEIQIEVRLFNTQNNAYLVDLAISSLNDQMFDDLEKTNDQYTSWVKMSNTITDGYLCIKKDFLIWLHPLQQNIKDYKIHCFNGKPKIILVCGDRFSPSGLTEDFFNTSWEHLDVRRPLHNNSIYPESKPQNLDKMLELAQRLSYNFPFLRTDFYNVDDNLYFGELTCYPASGIQQFEPEVFDYELGKLLDLTSKNST